MSEKEDLEDNGNDNDNGWTSDVTVDNKREEISLEFEDMDGHWEEAKKGEKKKNLKMADLVADLESCLLAKTATTESPALFDEAGTTVENDENKENSSSLLNGKLERRTVCHKGLRKEVLLETTTLEANRPPRARPITLVSAFSTNKCSRLEVRSLADMLEEEERDEKKVVEQIPDDVIIRFLLSADETAKRRKELRENLRRRFADFCNCHHALNCPSKSF